MKLKIFFFLFLSQVFISAQNNNFVYFPAHIGDTWQWHDNITDSTYSTNISNIIELNDGSTDVYFNNSENPKYNVRSNGNVYQYIGNNSFVIWYDFTISLVDTFYVTMYSAEYYVIVDSSEDEIFGEQSKLRKFTWVNVDNQYWRSEQWLSDKFGLISTSSFLGPLSAYVIGCKINGKKYGTLVSVENDSQIIPSEFVLYQNYPNPFNPETAISFQLSAHGFVTLKVFDLLGREIATLVNEEKPAGSYEVKFDASNLPSGIYFYRISVYTLGRTGNFSQTKKMVLLR